MDAVSVLKKDHREAEDMFALLRSARTIDSRKEIAIRLITELSRHDAVEVQLLYPALHKVGSISDEQVDEALQDHRDVRDKLSELDSRLDEVMTEDFLERWTDLETEVTAHVQEEERVLLPALEKALNKSDLEALGQSMETAKSIAPTHPHMSTPNNPLVATLLGSAMGVADRVKDAVSGQSEERKQK